MKSTERDWCLAASTTSVQKKTGSQLWGKGRGREERESSQVERGEGGGHEVELEETGATDLSQAVLSSPSSSSSSSLSHNCLM